MSLDGFIAPNNDDLNWLNFVQQKGEDYGYNSLTQNVDAYIVGRATYDVVLKLTGGEFPQAKQFDCYVITRLERAPENGVTFYNGELEALVSELKSKKGKNIYCDGGGQIVQLLMQKNLIDEYIISVIPTILGDGKRLFLANTPHIKLNALPSKQFSSGLVQLHYERVFS
ncbi:UNVERIFIED_CONTAM: hypothetical protein GTU68_043723 [Idotea baltica]|nr:hypothetical protein [Idotea baltica]